MGDVAASSNVPGWREVSHPVHGDRLEFDYTPTQIVTKVWTEWHRAKYDAKRAIAVNIGEAGDVEFVRELPGLRSVWVIDPLRDDTPVFDVPTLEQAVLYTRCKKPLVAERLPRLCDLIIDGRPGLESLDGHPSLRRLQVHGYGAGSSSVLGSPPRLRELALHGKWRPLDLTGLERLAALRSIRITEATLDSVAGVAKCPNLQHIELNVRTSDGRPVDVAPLADVADLRSLYIGRQPVRGLRALFRANKLVDVRFHGGAAGGEAGTVGMELSQQVREREESLMQPIRDG